MNPTFSPDGNYIAWESMPREGNESDKVRLMVMNLKSKEVKDISNGWDQSVATLAWDNDNQAIYLTSVHHGTTQIYKVNIDKGDFKKITDGQHDYESIYPVNNTLIAVRHSMSMPNEVYAVNQTNGDTKQLSFENEHLLTQLIYT